MDRFALSLFVVALSLLLLPQPGLVTERGHSVAAPHTIGGSQIPRIDMMTYQVNFTETGLEVGINWSVTLGQTSLTSNESWIDFAMANGSYQFEIGQVSGLSSNYRNGSVNVNGSGLAIQIVFGTGWNLTFVETGLTANLFWTVTVNNMIGSSSGNTINFIVPNATYDYSVSAVSNYQTSPSSGEANVSGESEFVVVTFTPTYTVTFAETGLSAGAKWTVKLGSVSRSSTSTSVIFSEIKGTYLYSVTTVASMSATPSSGNITVTGQTGVAIAFAPKSPSDYTVSFVEGGLETGTNWSVTVNKTVVYSTSTLIQFSESSGTFDFSIRAISGYTAKPGSGSVTVHKADVYQAVEFLPIYSVTFAETGLAQETDWNVSLQGVFHATNLTTVSVNEPSGSYAFAVQPVLGYSIAPSSGVIVVSGSPVAQAIVFTANVSAVQHTNSTQSSPLGVSLAIVGAIALLTASIMGAFVVGLLLYLMRRRRQQVSAATRRTTPSPTRALPKSPEASVALEPPAEEGEKLSLPKEVAQMAQPGKPPSERAGEPELAPEEPNLEE